MSPKVRPLAQGCSYTISMTFLRSSGQEYVYSLMTLLHISSLSYQRTQRHNRNPLKIWLHGRTSDTWSSTPLTVSGKKAPVHADYKLHDQTLTRVKSAKYLGDTLTNDLKWDQHIDNICEKANRTIRFLRRNLSIGATSLKERAYFTLVRPLVEYASTVWDP